ncbi:hypothetical protein CW304_26335 [Bacillus sp. UFRGS-B20]|nr:hypothetical protein CW304_26335 [Bacillus sp. UFRGS-B20]
MRTMSIRFPNVQTKYFCAISVTLYSKGYVRCRLFHSVTLSTSLHFPCCGIPQRMALGYDKYITFSVFLFPHLTFFHAVRVPTLLPCHTHPESNIKNIAHQYKKTTYLIVSCTSLSFLATCIV